MQESTPPPPPPRQEEFHAEGQTFTDDHLVIYGNFNTVTGDDCTVIGDRNRVTGRNATVIGDDNIVSGENASVQGDGNTMTENCASVEGSGNTVPTSEPGLLDSLLGAAEDVRDAPATTDSSEMILRMFSTASARVAKRPRVKRVSGTRILIPGPARTGFRISRGGRSGASVAINGIQLPVGTRILSQSSTGSVVELDPGTVDDLIRQYGGAGDSDEEQQQQQQQPSLREVLEDIKAKDRQADDDEGDKQCIVCCDRKKNVALNPCGHVLLCGECAIGLLKNRGTELTCPICSAEIKQAAFARL